MATDTTGADLLVEKKLEDLSIDNGTSTPQTSGDSKLLKLLSGPLETVTVPPPIVYTPEQLAKYETVLAAVKLWKEIPAKDNLGGPITEDEILWLTKECIFRYLRATKWVEKEAEKRLLGTLTWRREFGLAEHTPEHISPENETGKQMIVGYDAVGRPCHYLVPGNQNTAPSPRQVQHLVWMVERDIDLGIPGQEKLALLINFKASKSRSNTAPGMGIARECLNILQTHYPERLGKALLINIPWIVSGFLKLITPFIDPTTREKLKFNGDMREDVPPEHLWNEFQGDLEFTYDHDTYWPTLVKVCEEKKLQRRERWVKAGKQYGESEDYLKGVNVPSISTVTTTEEVKVDEQKSEEPAAVGVKE